MLVQRIQKIALWGAGIFLVAPMLSPALATEPSRDDPFFDEALFYAYQGNFFDALARLDAELAQHYAVDERHLDTFYTRRADAEFSVGDFELHYRMHQRAGRAISAVLEGDVEEDVRAEAAYRLARLHLQKRQAHDALVVLDSVENPPDELRDELLFLRANVLSALGRPDDAAQLLKDLQGSDELAGFPEHNLGIALLESQDTKAAIAALIRAGRVKAADRETRAIRDKSNLLLGTLLFEAGDYARAQDSLDRVRLSGPFSNQALLRAGWAAASAERFERAIVPWSILAERDPTDATVQEAHLALPFAYSKLAVHSRAAVLYERAARVFGSELEKLDASLASVDSGRFLDALSREEIRQNKDWSIRLRSLPGAPETFYLVSLVASHDFQTALQNYLDLIDMRRKLVRWRQTLAAFDDIVAIRRRHHEPRLPEIDSQFRRIDARIRVRLEQRKHLDERLGKLLTAPAPELLATAEENGMRQRLLSLDAQLAKLGQTPGAASTRKRLRRIKGVLEWRLQMQYHERLTEVHAHLRELNGQIDAMQAQYDSFVRTRQAASHSYVGYESKTRSIQQRVAKALRRIDELAERQGEKLEAVARRELLARRARIEGYQNKARFAFADSYDRASKSVVTEGD